MCAALHHPDGETGAIQPEAREAAAITPPTCLDMHTCAAGHGGADLHVVVLEVYRRARLEPEHRDERREAAHECGTAHACPSVRVRSRVRVSSVRVRAELSRFQ
jgi:hypothetical protein